LLKDAGLLRNSKEAPKKPQLVELVTKLKCDAAKAEEATAAAAWDTFVVSLTDRMLSAAANSTASPEAGSQEVRGSQDSVVDAVLAAKTSASSSSSIAAAAVAALKAGDYRPYFGVSMLINVKATMLAERASMVISCALNSAATTLMDGTTYLADVADVVHKPPSTRLYINADIFGTERANKIELPVVGQVVVLASGYPTSRRFLPLGSICSHDGLSWHAFVIPYGAGSPVSPAWAVGIMKDTTPPAPVVLRETDITENLQAAQIAHGLCDGPLKITISGWSVFLNGEFQPEEDAKQVELVRHSLLLVTRNYSTYSRYAFTIRSRLVIHT